MGAKSHSLIVVLLLGACGGPTDETVRAEFRREHPKARVISAGPGEGDSHHVYYHIRFREPPDTIVREVVWGYERNKDGIWRLKSRDVERPGRRHYQPRH
jgi:hypothetical protein